MPCSKHTCHRDVGSLHTAVHAVIQGWACRLVWNVMGMMNNPHFRVMIHADATPQGLAMRFEHPTKSGGEGELPALFSQLGLSWAATGALCLTDSSGEGDCAAFLLNSAEYQLGRCSQGLCCGVSRCSIHTSCADAGGGWMEREYGHVRNSLPSESDTGGNIKLALDEAALPTYTLDDVSAMLPACQSHSLQFVRPHKPWGALVRLAWGALVRLALAQLQEQ